MSDSITRAEVQQIRQKAIFNGFVTRSDIKRLTESWLDQDTALRAAALAERGDDQ